MLVCSSSIKASTYGKVGAGVYRAAMENIASRLQDENISRYCERGLREGNCAGMSCESEESN